jgi:hypothetical protein
MLQSIKVTELDPLNPKIGELTALVDKKPK